MDEILAFLLIVSILVGTIGATLIIHEVLESDYDKCLDSCSGVYENQQMESDCISECNGIFQDVNCADSDYTKGEENED